MVPEVSLRGAAARWKFEVGVKGLTVQPGNGEAVVDVAAAAVAVMALAGTLAAKAMAAKPAKMVSLVNIIEVVIVMDC